MTLAMLDPFLEQTHVTDEKRAMREAINAAIQQRKNKVYSDGVGDAQRKQFRSELGSLMRAAAKRYVQSVSDDEHFANIGDLAQTLTHRYGSILKDGRFRYGTAQKAFNLYLKFLWKLEQIPTPPHCPVDGIVLSAAGIQGSWTRSDDQDEYANWIKILRRRAGPLSLSDWEYELWLRRTAINGKARCCC